MLVSPQCFSWLAFLVSIHPFGRNLTSEHLHLDWAHCLAVGVHLLVLTYVCACVLLPSQSWCLELRLLCVSATFCLSESIAQGGRDLSQPNSALPLCRQPFPWYPALSLEGRRRPTCLGSRDSIVTSS